MITHAVNDAATILRALMCPPDARCRRPSLPTGMHDGRPPTSAPYLCDYMCGTCSHMDVGVRDLKARLSEFVGRASAGEEIVVTDRGRPVARLVPFAADSAVDRGIAEGWIDPPRRERLSSVGSSTIVHLGPRRARRRPADDALRRLQCAAQALRRRARFRGGGRTDGDGPGDRHVAAHRGRGSSQSQPSPGRPGARDQPPTVRHRSRLLRPRRAGRGHLRRGLSDRRGHAVSLARRTAPGVCAAGRCRPRRC